MMRIQKATREKFIKIADALIKKHGYEIVNVSNYTQLVKQMAERLDIAISPVTLREYSNYLTKIIKNKESESKDIFREVVREDKEESEVSILDNIDSLLEGRKKVVKAVVLVYEDLSKEVIWGEIKKKEEEKPPVLWIGLFDYKEDGSIVIRKDKRYIGCDVRDPQSVLKYFYNMDNFIEWCQWALNDVNRPGFNWNADTEKNIDTLISILEVIEKRKMDKFI
jgi:hypothetical protein